MRPEELIQMAREAGIEEAYSLQHDQVLVHFKNGSLERFADMVSDAEAKRIHDEGMVTVGHMREQIAAEREACAQVCDEASIPHPDETHSDAQWALLKIAVAIRARGQQ